MPAWLAQEVGLKDEKLIDAKYSKNPFEKFWQEHPEAKHAALAAGGSGTKAKGGSGTKAKGGQKKKAKAKGGSPVVAKDAASALLEQKRGIVLFWGRILERRVFLRKHGEETRTHEHTVGARSLSLSRERGRPFVSFCPFVRFFLNFCTFASHEEGLRAPYG